MEVQDCVVGLYQTVGRPLGDPFSTQDVSQLFGKVFHEPSNAEEVHAAITKISNGDSGWTCAGQNVLDVLREMEYQRVQNEKLYWECQLLNAVSNHQTQHVRNTRLTSDPFSLHHSYQKTSMRKLRKAHRQSWARLVEEGLASLLPARSPGCPVRSLSWGLVSLSELLLLVEVKYDVVNSLLYTEMLKEDYSADVWESLSPWEQREAEEGLAERAEQALESHDPLHLAQLPGALRTYR
uniref:Uncharacterized protein n=1 Tax=Knipowitschia caucasica TaxID=637954 RepID=A0AAV2KY95_KNICA